MATTKQEKLITKTEESKMLALEQYCLDCFEALGVAPTAKIKAYAGKNVFDKIMPQIEPFEQTQKASVAMDNACVYINQDTKRLKALDDYENKLFLNALYLWYGDLISATEQTYFDVLIPAGAQLPQLIYSRLCDHHVIKPLNKEEYAHYIKDAILSLLMDVYCKDFFRSKQARKQYLHLCPQSFLKFKNHGNNMSVHMMIPKEFLNDKLSKILEQEKTLPLLDDMDEFAFTEPLFAVYDNRMKALKIGFHLYHILNDNDNFSEKDDFTQIG